jgi:hypothetical protein
VDRLNSITISFELIWKHAGKTEGRIFAWLPVSMHAAYMFLALVTATESRDSSAPLKMSEKTNERGDHLSECSEQNERKHINFGSYC